MGRFREVLKTAGIFVAGTIIIVLVASGLIAWRSTMEFWETFSFCMILGGVVVMYSGAMVAAGGAEQGALRSAMMTGGHESNFYERYAQERQSRRDSQFYYMFLMLASGAILMAIGFWVLS